MKKKILFLLILFLPFFINAEEKCEIISGNGQDIGSEIACGTEHFYIVENKEDSVRMLAKYNLEIGYEFNKVIIPYERYLEFKTICNITQSYLEPTCEALLTEPEFIGYDFIRYPENKDGSYHYLMYNIINVNEVKQNSRAIGAHGDISGKPEFPEYGIVGWNTEILDYSVGNPYGNDAFIDYDLDGYILHEYDDKSISLNDYKSYLGSNGIIVNDISMLSVKEINDIVYSVSGEALPLDEWGNKDNWIRIDNDFEYSVYIVGQLKDYLPKGYEWLYSTTYFTKTYNYQDNSDYVYFVDTLGNLCNGFTCWDALGAGIRPVIEISKNSINYNLVTESEEGGTLEKVNETKVGDTIVLKPLAKAGYKLKGFTITTDSGQTIEIEEKDIFKNDDGTIIINPDVFVMPLENVIITARWGFTNPKTGVFDYISFIMIGMLICAIGYISINQYNRRFEL